MSLLRYFRNNKNKNTAQIAKERLQIIVSHRRSSESPDYLPMLRNDLIDVIAKYVKIDKDQVKVELARSGDQSVLELNVALPKKQSDSVAA